MPVSPIVARRTSPRTPYLVRSGAAYLFQIRIPRRIDPNGRCPAIRIGLGVLPAREARRQADILAGLSRVAFERRRIRRVSDGTDDSETDAMLAMAEVKGYLKAHHDLISQTPPEPAPNADRDALKGLVLIERELAKGPEANPLIADNADTLRDRYLRNLGGPTATVADRPIAEAQPTPMRHAPPQAPAPETSVARTANPAPTREAPAPERITIGSLGSADRVKDFVPAYELDRRTVDRPPSSKPLFSQVSEEYLRMRATKRGDGNPDVGSERLRRDVFLDLIGDHPIDTYNASDLQAFVNYLKYWPANVTKRAAFGGMTPRELIAANSDLHQRPLRLKTLQDGYVANVKAMMRFKMTELEYRDPFDNARIFWPDTAAPSSPREPLGLDMVDRLFKVGVHYGILDEAILPLMAFLTGRRLGLLIALQGSDLREKYKGVWVAQTSGIVLQKGAWVRVPYKTGASVSFFVLPQLLVDIGFVDWARQRDGFIFETLRKLADPPKSASAYMNRLLTRTGGRAIGREVFHSLRGGKIEEMRDHDVDPRSRRLQSGHQLGDEHEIYGFQALTEKQARDIARMPLPDEIDFSIFYGLDFDRMAKTERTRGRRAVYVPSAAPHANGKSLKR